MPIDLNCTPEKAIRQPAPSVKRWLIVLLVLISISGLLTAWLWPSGVSSQTPLFWLCFPGAAMISWLVIFVLRWVIYLAPVFNADGWDDTRQQDIEQDIWRGQRSMVIHAQVVHLPHAIATASISAQLLMTDGISLPLQVNNATQAIIHQARFDSITHPLEQRLEKQLKALLLNGPLQSAFHQLPANSELTILLQTNLDIATFPERLAPLQNLVEKNIVAPLRLVFAQGDGPGFIDNWLDNNEDEQVLLVLALNLSTKEIDGTSDAAVALLLQGNVHQPWEGIAYLHRPEQTHQDLGMGYALQQALLWGKSCAEDIRQIWFSGMGTTNKAENIFSQAAIQFSSAGQHCDIDLRTGDTEHVSSWLAIAVAAENARSSGSPQLLMNVSEKHPLPWFIVINPIFK